MKSICLAMILFLSVAGWAHAQTGGDDLTAWVATRTATSRALLDLNLSPSGYKRGFVVAAPWVVPGVQNYEYHWVRDAALVMNTYITAFADGDAQAFGRLVDYANFSRENQLAPGDDGVGLGEVKFNPDGSRYTAWMRPQNDGPALRAITLIRFMSVLSREGRASLARHLYDGATTGTDGLNAPGVVQADLDFVAAHWPDIGYDLWEEVKAHHFYTRLVQRKALLEGAMIAELYGDQARATLYKTAAASVEAAVNTHWIPAGATTPRGGVSTGQIWDSYDRAWGTDYKVTGLDVAAVLGALHAHDELDAPGDRFFSASDDRVLKTAWDLSRSFANEYAIAQVHELNGASLGAPIGRYPFDRFNGYDSSRAGNPWYLATAAYAELYYRCVEEWTAQGSVAVTMNDADFLSTLGAGPLAAGETIASSDPRFETLANGLRLLGDSYLRRVKYHEPGDGHFTEEYLRENGYATGAADLSWSYASVLTAARHR